MKYTARNGPQVTLDSQLFRLWDKFLGLYKQDKKGLSNKKKKDILVGGHSEFFSVYILYINIYYINT